MAQYPVSLPAQLRQEAEQIADRQGISLEQFILWAVAEKVGELRGELDDPAFPGVAYRRGAAGAPTPVVRGAGVRVQTLALAERNWSWTPAETARQYGLSETQVCEALAFYDAHRSEVDASESIEANLERRHA
jgi:uncharacterized protein (DUF433 family)